MPQLLSSQHSAAADSGNKQTWSPHEQSRQQGPCSSKAVDVSRARIADSMPNPTFSQPYTKMSRLRLCPCRSQNSTTCRGQADVIMPQNQKATCTDNRHAIKCAPAAMNSCQERGEALAQSAFICCRQATSRRNRCNHACCTTTASNDKPLAVSLNQWAILQSHNNL